MIINKSAMRLLQWLPFAAFVAMMTAVNCVAAPLPSHTAGVSSNEHPLPKIRESVSPALQQMLKERIASLGLTDAVRKKRLAVVLVDVTDPVEPKMAQVNGDVMMYAASLPKIAILLAAFERIQSGDLVLTDALRTRMVEMIRCSSNEAATEVIQAVGHRYINKVLASPRYQLYDPKYNGGLWVGKEYGKGSAYQRDPLHGLSHGATAIQVARFYYLLETGRLVSPAHSQEMKAILSHPAIRHKFVKGLRAYYPEAQMFRKSGTWRSWHADSALIERAGRAYIAVALANDPNGGAWLRQIIIEMDGIITQLHAEEGVEDVPEGEESDAQTEQDASIKKLEQLACEH